MCIEKRLIIRKVCIIMDIILYVIRFPVASEAVTSEPGVRLDNVTGFEESINYNEATARLFLPSPSFEIIKKILIHVGYAFFKNLFLRQIAAKKHLKYVEIVKTLVE